MHGLAYFWYAVIPRVHLIFRKTKTGQSWNLKWQWAHSEWCDIWENFTYTENNCFISPPQKALKTQLFLFFIFWLEVYDHQRVRQVKNYPEPSWGTGVRGARTHRTVQPGWAGPPQHPARSRHSSHQRGWGLAASWLKEPSYRTHHCFRPVTTIFK